MISLKDLRDIEITGIKSSQFHPTILKSAMSAAIDEFIPRVIKGLDVEFIEKEPRLYEVKITGSILNPIPWYNLDEILGAISTQEVDQIKITLGESKNEDPD